MMNQIIAVIISILFRAMNNDTTTFQGVAVFFLASTSFDLWDMKKELLNNNKSKI